MGSLIYEHAYDTTLTPSIHFPDYHFTMLNDTKRNILYNEALKQCAPNQVVLDLGSGSGLLSMMALRAGAKKVFAIEQDALLAQLSRTILTKNGFGDARVRVINAPISNLANDHEIDEPVDLIVTEIFDCGLIGEGCMTSIADAKSFLRPGGRIIPRQGSIHAFLVHSDKLRAQHLLTNHVMGFDLNELIELRQFGYIDRIAHYPDHRIVSDKICLLTLDFQQDFPTTITQTVSFTVQEDTHIDAMIVYFQLMLTKNIILKSLANLASHWDQWFLFPKQPIRAYKGETVTVSLHNRNSARLMASMWRVSH
jgi:predicted RNA methylase